MLDEYPQHFVYLYPDGHFETALELYSHAIRLNPYCAVYYGNRSFCSMKLENYGDALADANKALELDKTYIKVSRAANNSRSPISIF